MQIRKRPVMMEKIYKWQFMNSKNKSFNYTIADTEHNFLKRITEQYQVLEKEIMLIETILMEGKSCLTNTEKIS